MIRSRRHPRPRAWTVALAAAACLAAVAGAVPAPAGAEQAGAPPGAPRGRSAALDLGNTVSCVIRSGGSPVCWGANGFGQLGIGSTAHQGDAAGEIAALGGIDLGTGRTATAISASSASVCAILDDGDLACWGRNGFGQLGLGDTEDRGDQAGEMGDALPTVNLGTGRTATAISVGDYHSCAILDDGSVKCWGLANWGQLGLGDIDDRGDQAGEMGDALPTVDLGTGRTATAISVGIYHSCAILDDATLKCWGAGTLGRLGNASTASVGDTLGEMGDALPAVDLGGQPVVAVSAGTAHTCAITADGAARCWGNNLAGQLGLGDTDDRGDQPGEMGAALPAIDLGTGRTAAAIAGGTNHTCAILDDATLRCWGDNLFGQLGVEDAADRGDQPGEMGDALPTVDLGTGATAAAVGTGNSTCVALADGSVKCWGYGGYGALGSGSPAPLGDQAGEMGDALASVPLAGNPVVALRSQPAPPTGATGTGGPATWTVSWTAPADDGGSPLVGYTLQRSSDGVHWTPLVTTGPATEVTAPGTPGDAFAVRVAARNAIGDSPYGAPTATLVVGAAAPADDPSPTGEPEPTGGTGGDTPAIVPVDPARLLDTRPGGATVDGAGRPGGPVAAGGIVEVAIAGRGGVAANATAALLNVTAVGPAANGYAAVVPCGSVSNASNLNYQRGQDIANAVVAELSPAGSICIASDQTADYLVDVTAYVPVGSGLGPTTPARLLDTRPGGATVDGESRPATRVAAGHSIEVRVAGRGGVPADATTAVLNVTAVGPAAAGYAVVHPCGTAPNASSLNYRAGQDISNAVVAKLSPAGSICITSDQTADYLVDVNAWAGAGSGLATLTPARLLDTRPGGATVDGTALPGVPVAAAGTVTVQIAGRGGVPADATTAIVNLTAVGPDAAGYAAAFPCGTPPNASNLNYQPGQDIPSAAIVRLSATGQICLLTSAASHLLVDVTGYA